MQSVNTPKIKIRYGKLLDPFLKELMEIKFPEWESPTKEEVIEKVGLFRESWSKEGEPLLKEAIKVTGLSFERNVIDVFVVSGINRCMSAPLIVKSGLTEKEFTYLLLEELIHVLFSDNGSKIPSELEEHNRRVINHVMVFKIFREILSKEIIEELESKVKDPDYKKAWELSKNWNPEEDGGWRRFSR